MNLDRSLLEMFRAGADTSVLKTALKAHGFNVTEADVYNELHRLREEERAEIEKRERRRLYQRDWQRRYREDLRQARAGR